MNTQQTIQDVLTELTIGTPIEGIVIPIEMVPDPVFAEKMVGDGLAIDPTSNILIAPFDATVTQVQKTEHAITLQHECGLEILIHIGIDTVMLKGQGFNALVKTGDVVSKGQPLIEIDIDAVAQQAKSLVTVVVITNGDQYVQSIDKGIAGKLVTSTDMLMNIELQQSKTEVKHAAGYWTKSKPIIIPNTSGFHARPAAALVKIAKEYQADIELACKGERTNAKSLTNILKLNVQLNDSVTIFARGADANAAISELTPAIRAGLGDKIEQTQQETSEPQANDLPAEASLLFPKAKETNLLKGVSASPGIAFGVIHQIEEEELEFDELSTNQNEEIVSLDQAIFQSRQELINLQAELEKKGDKQRAKIFSAHNELLSDPELYNQTLADIRDGKTAAFAWRSATTNQANLLLEIDNPLLRERASDIADIGLRVLRHILGVSHSLGNIPNNAILIADDLTPSDTANLDTEKVAAFCTVKGGATSHSAILARSMNIPALAGIPESAAKLSNGTPALVNSDEGALYISPSEEQVQAQKIKHDTALKQQELNKVNAKKPALTIDNIEIQVAGNIGSISDAMAVTANYGDGVGLLRSEFIFMNRPTAPSEEEQYKTYRAAAESLEKGKPLIVRTLDVGGDKPLPYIDLLKEENPFLGVRGIRIGLDQPSLLRQQLRALLRASVYGNIMIMFPMISDRYELMLAKQLLEEERIKLNVKPVPVGIMIEVPSAAVMADILAPEVDFFSIGTNDLTQYTLAMDRGHPKLASLADALHPSVLRMIKMTADAAQTHDKWVGVCGGLASEPAAVPVLIGLGVTELSVSIPAIADVKAAVRSVSRADCKSIADQALKLTTAREVRELLEFK